MVGPGIRPKCLGVSKNREGWSKTAVFNFLHPFTPKSANAHAAEPNVRVRIGRSIVQIERERASVRSIVPIAAAKRSAPGKPRAIRSYTFFEFSPSNICQAS